MRLPDPNKETLIRRKALEMVVADGLDGFSMQKLARNAKMSPSTLYVYFADRDDLLFQLFSAEMGELSRQILEGMSADMSFADGLRVQWKNRMRYGLASPLQSDFLEQIRHTPYHGIFLGRLSPELFVAMRNFVATAVERGELNRMPVELYWSLAFAPLYQLIKFHRHGFGIPKSACKPQHPQFVLTDEILEQALQCVLRGLKPVP